MLVSVKSFEYCGDDEIFDFVDDVLLEADNASAGVDLRMLDLEMNSVQQILGEVSAAIMDRAYQASQATVTRLSPAALRFLF